MKERNSEPQSISWRQQRQISKEYRHVTREANRILKKHGARVSKETEEEIREALSELEQTRQQKEFSRVRRRMEKVDRLLEKHFARYRKSAFREYAESIAVAVCIALLLRAFVVEAFKIPSSSMIPTLRVGDHIFVSKFSYGLKMPFFIDVKFFQQAPERGEVIVFVYPKEPDKDFIKRVIAIGGDTVEVRQDIIYVNDKPIPRERLSQPCRYPDTQEGVEEWYYRDCVLYEEEHGGTKYHVVKDADAMPTDYGPINVPPGYAWVMGDNRDNSHDSRGWGPVPLSYIKGKAQVVWWSRGVPRGVRWDRMFHLVHGLFAKEF